MMAELRGALLFVVTFVFFLIIVGVLALSTKMKPARWSERTR